MLLSKNEWIKLTPLVDNGMDVVDIRVWKRTPTGGVPTKRSIIIEQRLVIPMIMGLQKVHRIQSGKTAVAQG